METETIERFFIKQCTPEEAKKVAAFLKAHPFVLEKYLSAHEWNAAAINENIPEELWNEVWQNIQKKNKAKLISLRLKRIAVAACVVVLLGAACYFLAPPKPINVPVAEVKKLPAIQYKTISNTTKKNMKVILEDSSVVQLSPASYLKYSIPFVNNKRDVFLEGEAKFHVVKNKAKPFTVYAGDLATTALGTIFSIKKNGNKNISVKLFEGKVVIHATDKNLKGWNKNVYLLAGQELKFDEQTTSFAVTKIANPAPKKSVANVLRTSKPANDNDTTQLNFSNTLLPEVIDRLSAYYNVTIDYDKHLIDTMNFTGSVSKKDSLFIILKAITQMNNLNLQQEEGKFTILKSQQQ